MHLHTVFGKTKLKLRSPISFYKEFFVISSVSVFNKEGLHTSSLPSTQSTQWNENDVSSIPLASHNSNYKTWKFFHAYKKRSLVS